MVILHLFEKLFNVYKSELGRVFYAWSLKFIKQVAIVIGWTTLVALFVARYSIVYLPFLYMVQAALMISGTMFFSFIADLFESRKIIFIAAFCSIVLFVGAGVSFNNDMIFFPLLLFANGFFIQQINVFLSSYIEDFFSPVEASRAFPLIESAETIAGIIGGIVLAGSVLGANARNVFFLWAFLMLLFLMVMFFLYPRTVGFYNSLYAMKILPKVKSMNWVGIKKSFINIARIPFLQVMTCVFFIQWFIVQLIEFQFTKVVDEGVLDSGTQAVHAVNLVHGLGRLHIFFFISAFLVQLLLASRILRFLGTVGGLIFHSLFTLMSAVSLVFGFGYFTTVMAKNNFEVSSVISDNAFESSYYAFPHGTQKTLREFFEGVLAPLATITATVFLLFTEFFFVGKDALIAINLLFLLLTVFTLLMSFFLQRSYSNLVMKNLKVVEKKISKMHAIDLLEQRGHVHGIDALLCALRNEEDNETIVRILRALGRIGGVEVLPDIEKMLDSKCSSVRNAVAKVIGELQFLKSPNRAIYVTRHRLIEKMKFLYSHSNDVEFKMGLLRSLSALEEDNVAGVVELLRNSSDSLIQEECMDILARYGDKLVVDYIKPFINSADYFVKAKAISTILHIARHDRAAQVAMKRMIRNYALECRRAVYSEFWNVRQVHILSMMKNSLADGDDETRFYAALGLVKSGHNYAAAVLADLLLFKNNLFFGRVKRALDNLSLGMKKIIASEIEKVLIRNAGLNLVITANLPERLELLGEAMLMRLKEAFKILNLDEEIELINSMLEYRRNLVASS